MLAMDKSKKVALALGAVLLVVIGVGAYLLLGNDAPERASLENATKGVRGGDGSTATSAGPGAAPADGLQAVAGDWVVDTTTGSFDWESATGTFAGFRVKEELANIGATEAVGRTGAVEGGITIKGSQVTKARFSVDLASLRTNNNMRDARVRRMLDTDNKPKAELRTTAPIDLPADAAAGGKLALSVPAELTVKGITRKVDLTMEAQFVDDHIVIVGSTPITFADYQIEVPSSPVVLSVQDHGEMEFQALLQRK